MAVLKKDRLELFMTYDGKPLKVKEYKFINKYIELGEYKQAWKAAGYKKDPKLLDVDYIANEIRHQMHLMNNDSIATAKEVMQHFTRVMRREGRDQFGIEISIADSTKAAVELAKRLIDEPAKQEAKNAPAEVKVVLDWGTMPEQAQSSLTTVKKDEN